MDKDIQNSFVELSDQVTKLTTTVEAMVQMNQQFVTHKDLANYLTLVSFEEKQERITLEVVNRVSGTLQSMVKDALTSAWQEDFRSLYREMSQQEREERREERKQEIKDALRWTQATVKFVLPVLQVISIIIGFWLAQ